MRCLELLWKAKSFVSAEESLADLPPDVTADLILHMRACHLRRHRFFSKLNTEEMRQVCIRSSEVFYMEGDELASIGSSAKSAFFLTRGTVEIVSRIEGGPPTLLVSPAWFGDLSLFNHGVVRTATVRAVDATSAIEVRQDVIAEMSSKYPHMSKLYEDFVSEADKDRSAFLNGGLKADEVEEEMAFNKMGVFQRAVYWARNAKLGPGKRGKAAKGVGRQRSHTSTFVGDPVLQEIRESHTRMMGTDDSSDSDKDEPTPCVELVPAEEEAETLPPETIEVPADGRGGDSADQASSRFTQS
jgi:hypothetical protein